MSWPAPVELTGPHATLRPLSLDHHDALCDAARDGELWQLWYTAVPSPEAMRAEIERRLALPTMCPFTVLDAAGRVVGMTTYMHTDAVNRRVEIGSTWYGASAQRTPLNTQCKRLLLAHCVRGARLHRGRVPHAPAEHAEPPRHRAPGCTARRHPARALACGRRHAARHRGLQHHRRRVADGAFAPRLAAGEAALSQAAQAPATSPARVSQQRSRFDAMCCSARRKARSRKGWPAIMACSATPITSGWRP